MTDKQTLHRQALDRSPGEIAIELTTHCNLTCKMCSVWKRREEELSNDKILSLMDEARDLGATGFTTCGAEPFMRPDTPEILAYAERIGFQELGRLRVLKKVLDRVRTHTSELRDSGIPTEQ